MLKIASWLLGFSLGGAAAALIVAVLVPMTSKEVRQRLKAGYHGALEAAKEANHQRRAELEAELARMQGGQTSDDKEDTPRLPAGQQ